MTNFIPFLIDALSAPFKRDLPAIIEAPKPKPKPTAPSAPVLLSRQIPDEVLVHIFSYLHGNSQYWSNENHQLFNAALVSKAWCRGVRVILYGELTLPFRPYTYVRLLRSFQSNPRLALLVKKVSVTFVPRELWTVAWRNTVMGKAEELAMERQLDREDGLWNRIGGRGGPGFRKSMYLTAKANAERIRAGDNVFDLNQVDQPEHETPEDEQLWVTETCRTRSDLLWEMLIQFPKMTSLSLRKMHGPSDDFVSRYADEYQPMLNRLQHLYIDETILEDGVNRFLTHLDSLSSLVVFTCSESKLGSETSFAHCSALKSLTVLCTTTKLSLKDLGFNNCKSITKLDLGAENGDTKGIATLDRTVIEDLPNLKSLRIQSGAFPSNLLRSLSSSKIEHLGVGEWPSAALVASFPPSLRTLAVDPTKRTSWKSVVDREAVSRLTQIGRWKQMGNLENLVFVAVRLPAQDSGEWNSPPRLKDAVDKVRESGVELWVEKGVTILDRRAGLAPYTFPGWGLDRTSRW
ncbi:hypothetical protein T439DRAFT_380658 [Meredithblackwellia eburnea MCA 4105]